MPVLDVSLRVRMDPPDFRQCDAPMILISRCEGMQADSDRVRRIESCESGLFAAPSLLGRAGSPSSPRELADRPCLASPEETGWTLHALCGETPSVPIRFSACIAATPAPVRLDFTCSWSAVVTASLGTCASLLAPGKLVPVLLVDAVGPGANYAARSAHHQVRRIMSVFMARLIHQVGQNQRISEGISANPMKLGR